MAGRMKRNIWRSERLLMRSAEPADEAFLQSMNDETSDGFQNSAPFLPVPQGAASAKAYREFLEKALLGCIICISSPTIAEEDSPATKTPDSPPEKAEPIPIGTVSLVAVGANLMHHRSTSLGVQLAPQHQGQGYGSEVILWALEWAFRHANLHRVGIGAFAYNEGAWKLYERLGFTHEGRKREAIWYDGEYHDTIDSGMLRREWQAKYERTEQNVRSA